MIYANILAVWEYCNDLQGHNIIFEVFILKSELSGDIFIRLLRHKVLS
jgi:hypothetical protein